MHVNLRIAQLKAAALIAAKDDIRAYLCGVAITPRETDAIITATDGKAMIVMRSPNPGGNSCPTNLNAPIIIPRAVVDGIKPLGKNITDVVLTGPDALQDDSELRLSPTATGDVVFRVVEGKFPDWTRVIPETTSGETAQFDPALMARVHKALNVARGSVTVPHVYHNGEKGTAVVSTGDPDLLVVIMPYNTGRTFEDKPEIPDWLDLPKETRRAA